MSGTTGWDALVLTVSTSPEGIDVRVGVVFVLIVAGIAWWIIDGCDDEDDGAKAA